MCKKILKILAGLVLIAGAYNVGYALNLANAWLIVGLYLLLSGLLPFVCKCGCGCCCGEGCNCEACMADSKKKKK
ncbi:MAG TPA: hypothetical protein PLO51_06175 [Candidatus Micrarchaeota archaeon]|nr:hypothetical protein [Candidatus Micrarchaeota archaeon]